VNTIQFQESVFYKSFKFLYIIVHANRSLKSLEKMYSFCFIWVRHEEENGFQRLNVGIVLKWNMLITKFHKFYHNIRCGELVKDLVSTCG